MFVSGLLLATLAALRLPLVSFKVLTDHHHQALHPVIRVRNTCASFTVIPDLELAFGTILIQLLLIFMPVLMLVLMLVLLLVIMLVLYQC